MRERLCTALDALAGDPDLVSALWSSFQIPQLARSVARVDSDPLAHAITASASFRDDFLVRITAFGVLGVLGGIHAHATLLAEIAEGDPHTRPYAALALRGNVSPESVPALAALLLSSDPFVRLAAQEAFLSIGRGPTAAVAHRALLSIALAAAAPASRIAALECLTPAPLQPASLPSLRLLAGDESESRGVRAAAIRALGRLRDLRSLALLSESALLSSSPQVRWAAVHALRSIDPHGYHLPGLLHAAALPQTPRALHPVPSNRPGAMHLAQFVTAGTGGLSTLTAGLHAAFSRRSDVGRITTVTWGGAGADPSRMIAAEPLVTHDEKPPAWDAALRIERALDHHFRAGLPHILHLRFADVGTKAAARWARRRAVPIYFTFAPDPIVPMHLAIDSGLLTRETLPAADARDHLVVRTSILHNLARTAEGIALLPRTDGAIQSLGPGIFAGTTRSIAEGIDVDAASRIQIPGSAARAVLEQAWSPVHGHGFRLDRRGLPVLVSVGRLHPVKGFARLVETWAGNADLARAVNLILIGGALEAPDATERQVLDDIARIVEAHPDVAGGLLLTGAQPHDRVPGLLAALLDGIPNFTAPRPIYVCPSAKEEFGLAILEAMAAGLPVVAPNAGGPATYLRDGTLGFLADTMNTDSLAAALRRALSLRGDAGAYRDMTARGRNVVRERYAVDRMAAELMALYREGAAVRLASAS